MTGGSSAVLLAIFFIAGFIVVNQAWRLAPAVFKRGASKAVSADENYHRKVLGVSVDADREMLQSAYEQRMAKYHPSKFVEFGPEFEAAAVERTEQIVAAYN